MKPKDLHEMDLEIDRLLGYEVRSTNGVFIRGIGGYPTNHCEAKTDRAAKKKLVPKYTSDIVSSLILFEYSPNILELSIRKQDCKFVASYIIWSRFQNQTKPTILVSDEVVTDVSIPYAIASLWLKLRKGDAWSVLKYLENKVA